MKSLVVYYSRTGNTRFVAEKIAEKLNADVEELIDKKKRSGIIGWLGAGKDATRKKETAIVQTKYPTSDYDLIILGNPVWNKRLPPAMRTYLNRNDISENKIALFNTNGSDENENTFSTMMELAKNQTPIAQLVVSKVKKDRTEVERKIDEWCKELSAKLNPI